MWGVHVPELQKISGFLDVYVLEDAEEKQGMTVTLWDSEVAAQEYLQSDTLKRVDRDADEFRAIPNRRIMTVFASLAEGPVAP
jgi:heme-degrading monooxygenase HmoA